MTFFIQTLIRINIENTRNSEIHTCSSFVPLLKFVDFLTLSILSYSYTQYP